MLITLFATIPFRHRFAALLEGWQQLLQVMSDPYRPELHYMRGPGPKWHARQQREQGF